MIASFDREQLAIRLGALLGDVAVEHGPAGLCAVPADEQELAAVLALASEAGADVIPCGLGSKLGWTALPAQPALLVSTRRMAGVLSYEPADGTLAARAGSTMAQLRATVLAGGHALTPDVPGAERATLGGVLAAGQSAFDRERYGPVRHHVLGARVMLADGTCARSGGQLVKNVTGFDLQRLYTGSHGSLCVILEAALRLFPAPEHEALVMATASDVAGLQRMVSSVRATAARPLALLAGGSQPPDARGHWSLFAHLGGRPEVVTSEIELLRAAWSPCGVLTGAEAVREHAELRERAFEAQSHSWLRGTCAPSACAQAVAALQAHLRQHSIDARLWVQPGQAVIDAQVREASAASRLAGVLAAWRANLAPLGGRVQWRNAPDTQRSHAQVWGPAPRGLALMRRLKHQLDPEGLFASGRLAGGL